MIKRKIAILLCLMLLCSVYVSATETSKEAAPADMPAATEEMPVRGGGMGGGRRGGMGGPPPQGGEMPEGEMPTMPEGEMPPTPEGEAPAMPQGEMNERMPQGTAVAEAAPETQNAGSLWEFVKTYETPVVSLVLLAFAFVFVICYKHRNY